MKQGQESKKNIKVELNPLKLKEFEDYVHYLSSKKRVFWINFIAGAGRGLGFVMGTVVIMAIAGFVIGKILVEIPWIGELFQSIDQWMKENIQSYQTYIE